MLRRRPVLRTAVGTAVVAGTATAVSGRVARRQDARAAAPARDDAAPVVVTERDRAAQLGDLASLREQGVITEAEFQAEKERILARD